MDEHSCGYFCNKKGKSFAETGMSTKAKTSESVGRRFYGLPSDWVKFERFLVKLFVVMTRQKLNPNTNIFHYWNIVNVSMLLSLSEKNTSPRSIHP